MSRSLFRPTPRFLRNPTRAALALVALILGSGFGVPAAQAAIAPLQQTSTLLGDSGVAAGDYNGDGLADTLWVNRGNTVSVLFGTKAAPLDVDTSQVLGSRGVSFTGATIQSVAAAGDVDGDGLDDFVVVTAGTDYIVYGSRTNGGTTQSFTSGSGVTAITIKAGYTYHGEGIGDFNGDGYDDVALERFNYGLSIVYGGPRVATINGNVAGSRVSLVNASQSCGWYFISYICTSVTVPFSRIGDFNGDGKADLEIDNGGSATGVRILLGREGIFAVSANAAASSGTIGLPSWANPAGDVNGDGKDDIVLGGNSVVLGRTGPTAAISATEPAIHLTAANPPYALSAADGQPRFPVVGIGDQNGDGKGDLLALTGINPFSAKVVTSLPGVGSTVNLDALPDVAGVNGRQITGAISALGDVDGDGAGDVLLAADPDPVSGVTPVSGGFLLTHNTQTSGGNSGPPDPTSATLTVESDVIGPNGAAVDGQVTTSAACGPAGAASQDTYQRMNTSAQVGAYTLPATCSHITSTLSYGIAWPAGTCAWVDTYGLSRDAMSTTPPANWQLKPGANFWFHVRTCTAPQYAHSISDAGWLYAGGAAKSGTRVLLAKAAANQTGSIIWNKPVDYNNLSISVNVEFSAGNGGGEGMAIGFITRPSAPTAGVLGTGGPLLGFGGLTGTAVTLDTSKSPGDPSANFVGITDGAVGGQLHLLQTADPGQALRNNHAWQVRVVSKNGVVNVWVNNSLRLSRTMTLPPDAYLMFSASTGATSYQNEYVGSMAIGDAP